MTFSKKGSTKIRPGPRTKAFKVQCSAVQCSAVQCSAVQCSAVQCTTVIPTGPSVLQATASTYSRHGSKIHPRFYPHPLWASPPLTPHSGPIQGVMWQK